MISSTGVRPLVEEHRHDAKMALFRSTVECSGALIHNNKTMG